MQTVIVVMTYSENMKAWHVNDMLWKTNNTLSYHQQQPLSSLNIYEYVIGSTEIDHWNIGSQKIRPAILVLYGPRCEPGAMNYARKRTSKLIISRAVAHSICFDYMWFS